MISEESVLMSAISYLQSKLPGIRVLPFKQKFESADFPCVAVNVHTRTSQMSIHGEELALVTIKISAYADDLYVTPLGNDGVMTIYDKVGEAMVEKGYQRVTQTDPFYASTYRKWCRDGNFHKITNVF